jgi:hypothetical protein
MKWILVLFVGLFAGSVVSFSVTNVWLKKNAYPKGVMALTQYHFSELRKNLSIKDCAIQKSAWHLQRLHLALEEIPEAFPMHQEHIAFQARFQKILELSQSSPNKPLINCVILNDTVRELGEQCNACHQQFQ